MIRVVIVDDHPIVRSGLAALLTSDPAFEVVAAAGSVAEAGRWVAADSVMDAPELAVIDLRLPDGDGVDLALHLRQAWPHLKVLVLTMDAEAREVTRAVAAGLHGYLLKDADPESILTSAHQVAGGSLVIGPGADSGVRAAAATGHQEGPGLALRTLNAREREILDLLACGLTTAEVARRLYLAPKTIRNRLTEILDKLGVATREEAIDTARAAGLGSGRLG